jgi:hypothetical protein
MSISAKTGATGKTGRAVVDELLAKGVPVRAVVHSKDARSTALERMGAETVVTDMFDSIGCSTLCAKRARLLSPVLRSLSAATFAIAAQEAKLEAVVSLGQWLTIDSTTTSPSWPLHSRPSSEPRDPKLSAAARNWPQWPGSRLVEIRNSQATSPAKKTQLAFKPSLRTQIPIPLRHRVVP